MSTRLTDDKNVKLLTDMFELDVPKSHRLVVTDWTFDKGMIVIKGVDVYNTDNKFVKKADLSMLREHIQNYSVVFRTEPPVITVRGRKRYIEYPDGTMDVEEIES